MDILFRLLRFLRTVMGVYLPLFFVVAFGLIIIISMIKSFDFSPFIKISTGFIAISLSLSGLSHVYYKDQQDDYAVNFRMASDGFFRAGISAIIALILSQAPTLTKIDNKLILNLIMLGQGIHVCYAVIEFSLALFQITTQMNRRYYTH